MKLQINDKTLRFLNSYSFEIILINRQEAIKKRIETIKQTKTYKQKINDNPLSDCSYNGYILELNNLVHEFNRLQDLMGYPTQLSKYDLKED